MEFMVVSMWASDASTGLANALSALEVDPDELQSFNNYPEIVRNALLKDEEGQELVMEVLCHLIIWSLHLTLLFTY